MTYKCISVAPNYAMDFLDGSKDDEYRSWYTNYRGPILICSTAKPMEGCISGHAVMLADIVDVTGHSGDYTWVLKNHRLIRPFAVKGKQRIFEIDAEVEVFTDNTPQAVIDAAYLPLIRRT